MAAPPKPIREMMADCTERTKREFEFEDQLMMNIGGINIEIFDLIFKGSVSKYNHLAVLITSIRTFRFLDSAGDNIFNGYYDVAMTLLRQVYENLLLITYLADKEDEAEKWINGQEYRQQFLRKQCGQSNSVYAWLSTWYTHPNSVHSAVSIMKNWEEEKMELVIYPEFNKKQCETAIHLYIMLGWLVIVQLQYTFRDLLWQNEKWKNQFIDWNEVVMFYVKERIMNRSKLEFEFITEVWQILFYVRNSHNGPLSAIISIMFVIIFSSYTSILQRFFRCYEICQSSVY